MIEVWKEVLHIDNVGVDDDFFTLGGNSDRGDELLLKIEEVFGMRLPVETLLKAPTPRQCAMTVQGCTRNTTSVSLAPVKMDSGRPPLFLLHGLFLYRELACRLGADQRTIGIYVEEEMRTRRQSTFSFSSVEELANRYIEEIYEVHRDGPYQLGGESFGGLIAFDVAQKMIRQGREVTLLTLFDTHVPRFYDRTSVERIHNHLAEIRKNGAVHLLSIMENAVSRFLNTWRKPGRADPGRFRARIVRRYQVRAFPAKIVLFKAAHNDRDYSRPEDLGWSDYARELVVHRVPGDHIGILKPPNVGILAEKLIEHLKR